ncbi:hypothetical protein SAMN04515671_2182 [Nakamurella panacisegetis]|uniref:Uncharacterized protein n=1 Tax=Nakamurella panacisegetis TaxID=1090615 RepID=A0A1H0N398_9ACTN|nr:ribonuclease domain-containing protein [Nakamurella panacisegetis]SDO87137.1 hypothetical protein SAMN04515671_2182 [Nakamurella panacisegetis]
MTAPLRARRSSTTAPRSEATVEPESSAPRTDSRPVAGLLTGGPALAPLRRQMIDSDLDDEIFEVEAAKRQAKVADMNAPGGKIAANDPRRAALHALVRERTATPGAAATAEAKQVGETAGLVSGGAHQGALNTHLKTAALAGGSGRRATAEAKEVGATQKTVTGADHAGVEAAVAKKQKAGPDVDQEQALGQKSCLRMARLLAKELAAGKAAKAPEFVAINEQIVAKDYVKAAPLLDEFRTTTAAILSDAETRKGPLLEKAAKVLTQLPCHIPTGLAEAIEAIEKAVVDRNWVSLTADLDRNESLVEKAIEISDRFEAVETETATVQNSQQKLNLEKWMDAHKKMSWDQVLASENKSQPNEGLGGLEAKIAMYAGRDPLSIRLAAEAKAEKEKREKLRADQIAKGLLAGNGTIIKERTAASFTTGPGEKDALEDAIAQYRAGSSVTFVGHPPGVKWGEAHANRDGDLPGVKGAGGYREYYVQKEVGTAGHGIRRLVVHVSSGRIYYSRNHYGETNDAPPFFLING